MLNYLPGTDAVMLFKVCKRFGQVFNDSEKEMLRLRCALYAERKKQSEYVESVMTEHINGVIDRNQARIARGKKPKKMNHYFCEGCAQVINPGLRRVHHCANIFRKCPHCDMSYARSIDTAPNRFGRVFYNVNVSSHGDNLVHNINTCPKHPRNISTKCAKCGVNVSNHDALRDHMNNYHKMDRKDRFVKVGQQLFKFY